MKISSIIYFLLLIIIVSCSKSSEIPVVVDDVSVAKTMLNVSYGSSPQQVFDLYLPANRSSTTTKTLILVHGGSWVSGDKDQMKDYIPFLQQNFPNYAIANINYRLATAGNYAFPMQLDDMNAVFLKLLNDNNDISDNFGYIGVSAGAHLSMLYTYKNNSNNHIKMVASIIGPTNFRDINYTNNPAWIDTYLYLTGVNYADNPTYFETLSPYYVATSSSAPTLLLYGNADDYIPNTQATAMKDKLDQLGVYNELKFYNGGHGNWAPIDLFDSVQRLKNFIALKF